MPYTEWEQVNAAIKGIEPRVSLVQANEIAAAADAIERSDSARNPWAVAIARFKQTHEVQDGRWVRRESEAGLFCFVELQAGVAEEARPVEFLRVGVFRDRNGKEVEVSAEDLDSYVENFAAGAAGQDVPIDVEHRKGEAAGWLRGMWREGDKLFLRPDWTDLGRQLVGGRIYRYVSAWLDLANKVIKSVSLVNFPAVKGLAPVELSEGVWTMGKNDLLKRIIAAIEGVFQGGEPETEGMETEAGKGDPGLGENHKQEDLQMTEEEKAELREQIREELRAEMQAEQEKLVELREEVKAELRGEIETELREAAERRAGFAEFANEVTGRDAEFGISLSADEVVELLEVQPDETAVERVKDALKSKVVEFGERGSSREGAGGKEKLDQAMAAELRSWLAADQSLEEFFEVNSDELGKMSQYDLAEFKKEKED